MLPVGLTDEAASGRSLVAGDALASLSHRLFVAFDDAVLPDEPPEHWGG